LGATRPWSRHILTAWQTARRLRKTLADELGLDPGRALRELEAEVLAQSLALYAPEQKVRTPAAAPTYADAHVPTQRPADRPVRRPAAQFSPADTLVGREHELGELRTCLEEAWSGQGRLALVEGPSGIGKAGCSARRGEWPPTRVQRP
jgi:transcriptional regulator with AAA-type ATPase domain